MRSISLVSTLALALMCSVASSPAEAQGIASSYDQLRLVVRPGDTVTVVDAKGRESTGRIADLSSSLVLQVKGERVEVLERDVQTIRQRKRDSLWNGVLWGGGTAAAAGFLVGQVSQALGGPSAGVMAAFHGAIGLAIGVGSDAAVSDWPDVYARPGTASTRIRLSPLVSRDRRGVQLGVRF
jgi:hypothetical protein